jgi:hypothetical protein
MKRWLLFVMAVLLMVLYAQLESMKIEDRLEAADQLFRP